MYENVHPNLAMVLLFVPTELECGKGLLLFCSLRSSMLYHAVLILEAESRQLLSNLEVNPFHSIC